VSDAVASRALHRVLLYAAVVINGLVVEVAQASEVDLANITAATALMYRDCSTPFCADTTNAFDPTTTVSGTPQNSSRPLY